ncbi:MAG TPA: hypothetical protein VLA66_10490 [Thermoanaerobaculia bacterium]|nr:hypothetical protein [Thermoanaerobaculia bacterium]
MIRPGPGRARSALLASALLVGALCPPAAAGEPRLSLAVDGPTFEGRGAALEIAMRGALETESVTFTVFIDDRIAERFDARGPRARHRLVHPSLTAGVHRIVIKTGSEKARAEIRVLPGWWPPAGAALLFALLLLAAIAILRRRRGTAT